MGVRVSEKDKGESVSGSGWWRNYKSVGAGSQKKERAEGNSRGTRAVGPSAGEVIGEESDPESVDHCPSVLSSHNWFHEENVAYREEQTPAKLRAIRLSSGCCS